MNIQLKSKKTIAAIGICTVLVGAGITVGSVSSAFGTPYPLSIVESVSKPTGAALPAAISIDDVGQSGLDTSTVTQVGADGRGTYWVAKDNSANICIIVELKPSQLVGTSCTPAELFAKNGSFLVVQDEDPKSPTYVEAYLLPDNVKVTSVGGLEGISPNLLVGDRRQQVGKVVKNTTLSLPTDSGQVFKLSTPTVEN